LVCAATFPSNALLWIHIRLDILAEESQTSKPQTTAKESLHGFNLCEKCKFPFSILFVD
jgi:hypothetical protein